MFRPATTAPAPAVAVAVAVAVAAVMVVAAAVAAAARPSRDRLFPAVSRRTVRSPRAPGPRPARRTPPLPPVQPGQLLPIHRHQPACQPRSPRCPVPMLFPPWFRSPARPHRPVFPSFPVFPRFPVCPGLPAFLLQPRYPEPDREQAPRPGGQPVAQMAATGSKQPVEFRNPRG